MKHSIFINRKCNSEEEVKALYVRAFDLQATIKEKCDLQTEGFLWEFKHDVRMRNLSVMSKVAAQATYYLMRNYRKSNSGVQLAGRVVLADQNEAVILSAVEIIDAVRGLDVDFDRLASSPDPSVVAAVAPCCERARYFNLEDKIEYEAFEEALKTEAAPVKKLITIASLQVAFDYWVSLIGVHFKNKNLGKIFVSDTMEDHKLDTNGRLSLVVGQSIASAKIPIQDYEKYWSTWDRPPDRATRNRLIRTADRLMPMELRKTTGAFFTPPEWCTRIRQMLDKELGESWQDEYYVWDPAAGTGNLVDPLDRHDRCFCSTLEESDVAYIQAAYPDVTAFQYNFVIDDAALVKGGADLLDETAGWKMPLKLRQVLADPNKKLLVLMNPPYAEVTDGIASGATKIGVSSGAFTDGLGKAGNELFSQFMLRAKLHDADKIVLLSKAKLLQKEGMQKLRDQLPYECSAGFVFPSGVFHGVKGEFPILVQMYYRSDSFSSIAYFDVLDKKREIIGARHFVPTPRPSINKWVKSPKNTEPAVPLTNAIKVATDKIYGGKQGKGAIGFIGSGSPDMQEGRVCSLFSSITSRGVGWSILKDDLPKDLAIFAVRKATPHTWLNDGDVFTVPRTEPDGEFMADCAIYSTFENSNLTAGFRAEYKGVEHRIYNHFLPYDPKQMASQCNDDVLATQLERAKSGPVNELLRSMGGLLYRGFRVVGFGHDIAYVLLP